MGIFSKLCDDECFKKKIGILLALPTSFYFILIKYL
jgi:hypothetical protein